MLRVKRNTPLALLPEGPRIELVGLTRPLTSTPAFTLSLRFASGAEATATLNVVVALVRNG